MSELIQFLHDLEFWHWWVLAALLIAFEVFVPSTVLLWPGIAAAIVGLIVLIVPAIGWQVQVLLFAFLSVATLVTWRAYARMKPDKSEESHLNRRADQYIGRLFTLGEPIVNGRGKMMADGMLWTLEGDDLDSGERVRVTGTDGVILKVEQAVDDPGSDIG